MTYFYIEWNISYGFVLPILAEGSDAFVLK